MRRAMTERLEAEAIGKKDGIYSHKGNLWVVKDEKFVAFANYFGNCYQRCGETNKSIGRVAKYDRKKKLTDWLQSQY